MPGLYASLIGGAVIVGLVVIGLWLTWISLRSDHHQPAVLGEPDPDEAE